MRVPSGEAPAPCPASMSLISPTTLFVAGSMIWTLSPALLVWMILTLLCAESESVHIIIAPIARTKVRGIVVIALSFETGMLRLCANLYLFRLTHNPRPQHLPLRIVLRGPMLATAVKEVSAARLFECVDK